MILPHVMSVERLSMTNATKESYTARPDVPCFLQPVSNENLQVSPAMAFTKTSRCFIPYAANVKLKDRVTIDGITYNVSGERTHQYGSFPHRVLSLEALA